MNIGANKWNTEQLDRVVDVFKDHKIPKNIAYKLLKPGSMGIGSVEKWVNYFNFRWCAACHKNRLCIHEIFTVKFQMVKRANYSN